MRVLAEMEFERVMSSVLCKSNAGLLRTVGVNPLGQIHFPASLNPIRVSLAPPHRQENPLFIFHDTNWIIPYWVLKFGCIASTFFLERS